MSNFIVVDHSIKRMGGHNYEYALHILTAAERQGYRPILAVNRRFFERQRLPPSWQIHALFHHTTYETSHLAAKQRSLDPDGAFAPLQINVSASIDQLSRSRRWLSRLPGWLRRSFVERYERQKQSVIDRYAADLESLFSSVQLAPGDHVFVPTISQDDLAGLVRFLRAKPGTAIRATWHLQFHFGLYEGRATASDGDKSRRETLTELLRSVSQALPYDYARFYTTTEILADQYSGLGAGKFRALPYPVDPALLNSSACPPMPQIPLRVTCAGGVRAEKRTSDLYRIVAPIWHDEIDAGRMQLVVQAKRMGKLPRELRRYARPPRSSALLQHSPSQVEFIRWPASTEQYLELIRSSHVGLLLYDANQYYARCSGVMVEMLKAGVPVIVPAGCWMADQVAESIFAHRDSLCQTTPLVTRLTPAEADWVAGPVQRYRLWRRDSHLLVGEQSEPIRTWLTPPAAASHLCIRFRWAATNPRGSYLQIASVSKPVNEQVRVTREVVGIRKRNLQASVLLPLPPASQELQLTWHNAFGSQQLELEDVEFLFLSAKVAECPLGAVGLVAAGVDQAAALLRDIANHYAHYRRTAEEFAPAWGEWHSPTKVLQLLTSKPVAESRFAA